MPNYNSTLQTNNSSLEEIITQLNNMPEAGEGLDTSDATASASDILNGKTAYVKGEKITGGIPTVEVTEPIILVDQNSGKITATASQDRGYTTGAIKTTTKQLAFQAAQTITPGTTDQTIAANTYLGGAQTIKGDSNLVASNIVSGKSIFGVVGTASTGGGGDTNMEDALITGAVTTYTNNRVTSIASWAFSNNPYITDVYFPQVTSIDYSAFGSCHKLTGASFPACVTISSSAFIHCTNLANIYFPKLVRIGTQAFNSCSSLINATFPACTNIYQDAFKNCISLISVNFPILTEIAGGAFTFCKSLVDINFSMAKYIRASAFNACTSLTNVDFPAVVRLDSYAFYSCTNLITIYLRASSICTLAQSNVFSKTGIWSNKGSIFVPASLVASYQAATNWAFFSARIFAIEDGTQGGAPNDGAGN